MQSISIKIPGKLFLAGEYAVVKGYHAILLVSNQTLDVTISTHHTFQIESTQWEDAIVYDIDNLDTYDTIWSKALVIAYAYVLFKGKSIQYNHISISSKLDSESKKKLGLGSSGALVVGLIEAMLNFHEIHYTSLELYKLAVLSQYDEHTNQSFGDIAAASFKSALLYKKFKPFKSVPQSFAVLNDTWEALVIEPFQISNVPLVIINTGVEARSSKLVDIFFSHVDETMYETLFAHIDTLTIQLYDALMQLKPFDMIIQQLMTLYENLPNVVKENIINEPIQHIISIARRYHTPYKFSGAGGGDNMILYIKDIKTYQHVKASLDHDQYEISHLIEGVQRYE